MISNFKFIMPISDDNLWILKICFVMYEKYWPKEQQFIVLGFKKPDFEMPSNWLFVSLDTQQKGGAQNWSKYIANYLKTIDDEAVIFGLEDFIPTDHCLDLPFLQAYYYAQDNLGRFELGWDTHLGIEHKEKYDLGHYKIIQAKNEAMYRISTQTSLWKKKYLIKYLDRCWSPWQFEVEGSIMATFDDKFKVLACKDEEKFRIYPAKWIHKGAISRLQPGKFNVLGLKLDDIKYLCDLSLIKQEDLIMGQWQGYVPTFNELGGFNLDFEKFRNIESIKQYTNHNWREYENIYNNKH